MDLEVHVPSGEITTGLVVLSLRHVVQGALGRAGVVVVVAPACVVWRGARSVARSAFVTGGEAAAARAGYRCECAPTTTQQSNPPRRAQFPAR